MAERLYAIGSGGPYSGYIATYATLDDWQNAHKATDWVAEGAHCVAEIQEDLTVGSFTFAGWTSVDSSTGPIIRCAPGKEHNGNPAGGVNVTGTTTWSKVIVVAQAHALVQGIRVTTTANASYGLELSNDSATVDRVIARGSTNYGRAGIRVASNGWVTNSIFRKSGNGVYVANWKNPKIRNCTAVDNTGNGFYKYSTGGTPLFQNCCAVNNGTDFNLGSQHSSTSNNASSDATAPGANSITGVSTADGADFVSPSTGDYHLTSGSVLKGAGVNLYDGSGTQTDIDGDPWPATGAWDIGADSYYVPATANTSDIPSDVLSLAAQALSATVTDAQLSNLADASVSLQAQIPTVTSSELSQADIPSTAVALTSATPTATATANNSVSLTTAQIQFQVRVPQSQTSDYQQSNLQAATVALLPNTPSAQTSEHNQIALPAQSLTVQPQTLQAIAGASNSASIASVNIQLQTSVPSAQTTEHNQADLLTVSITLQSAVPQAQTSEHVWSEVASSNIQTQANAPTATASEHQTSELLSTSVDLTSQAPAAQTTELNSAVLVSDALAIQSQAPQAISGADNSASITSTGVQVQANAPTIQTTELNTVDLLSANLQVQGQALQATALAHVAADLPSVNLQIQGQVPQTYAGNSQLAELPATNLPFAAKTPSAATTEHVWSALASASVFTQPQIPSFLTTEDMDVILPAAALNLTEYVPTAQTYFSGISVSIQLTATLPKTISLVAKI